MKKLLELQAKIKVIKKDEVNPFFKSKYFDINGLIRELKPLLSELKLVIIQPLSHVEGRPAIRTILIDGDTGEKIVEDVVTIPENLDPQKMGSTITYFRRYSLQSLLLLEAEDDDGNATSSAKPMSTAYGAHPLDRAPEAPKYNQGGTGKCKDCGADMIMSKAGKIYCSKTCWLPPKN